VDEAVDVVLQADECAEAGELGDMAGDEVADFIVFVDVAPRVFGELFDADSDALVGFVDFEDLGFDFVALLEDFGRVIDLASPGDVGDVDHAIETFFEFDEGAVADRLRILPLTRVPGGYFSRALSHGLASSGECQGRFFCLVAD
jgi:hypothetical protein